MQSAAWLTAEHSLFHTVGAVVFWKRQLDKGQHWYVTKRSVHTPPVKCSSPLLSIYCSALSIYCSAYSLDNSGAKNRYKRKTTIALMLRCVRKRLATCCPMHPQCATQVASVTPALLMPDATQETAQHTSRLLLGSLWMCAAASTFTPGAAQDDGGCTLPELLEWANSHVRQYLGDTPAVTRERTPPHPVRQEEDSSHPMAAWFLLGGKLASRAPSARATATLAMFAPRAVRAAAARCVADCSARLQTRTPGQPAAEESQPSAAGGAGGRSYEAATSSGGVLVAPGLFWVCVVC